MTPDERVIRYTRRYNLAKLILLVYVVLVQTVSLVILYRVAVLNDQRQLQNQAVADKRLKDALAENEEQHRLTQQYVKCVAEVLLIPLDERMDASFEQCGQEAQVTADEAAQAQQAQPQQQQQARQQRNEAPVSEPPPSETAHESPQVRADQEQEPVPSETSNPPEQSTNPVTQFMDTIKGVLRL